MHENKIFLELSAHIKEVLLDNMIDIADILEKETIDGTISYEVPPYSNDENGRTKDLVPVILASATAVTVISFAITNLLNTLYRKPHFVEYYENIELKDPAGNIILDESGNAKMALSKKHDIIEPKSDNNKSSFEANFGLTKGITIKFSTEKQSIS